MVCKDASYSFLIGKVSILFRNNVLLRNPQQKLAKIYESRPLFIITHEAVIHYAVSPRSFLRGFPPFSCVVPGLINRKKQYFPLLLLLTPLFCEPPMPVLLVECHRLKYSVIAAASGKICFQPRRSSLLFSLVPA